MAQFMHVGIPTNNTLGMEEVGESFGVLRIETVYIFNKHSSSFGVKTSQGDFPYYD